jgi:excisionase family DNA binding protein
MMPFEVMAYLGVSRTRLYVLATSGRIPHTKTIGGHRRYRFGDVKAFKDARDNAMGSK